MSTSALEALPPDLLRGVLELCAARDVGRLAQSCSSLRDALVSDEALWERLYRQLAGAQRHKAPRFPAAGSWREAAARAARGEVLVFVRVLGPGEEHLRLTIGRRTTLFGLKKVVRAAQLRRFGLALDDFELVESASSAPLGVQGFDSLPPSDLSILFVSSGAIWRSVQSNETFRRLVSRHQRPAWRKDLLYVPDGLELTQVFVGNSGEMVEGAAGLALQQLAAGELTGAAERVTGAEGNGDRWAAFGELCSLLRECSARLRYHAHKPYWPKAIHPLLGVALAPLRSGVPYGMRALALAEWARQLVAYFGSSSFWVNGVARAFVGSGFPAVFVRLIVSIVPLLLQTQIKQVMEGEIDWVPLVFATRFLAGVALLVVRSASPMVGLALAHQAILGVLRSIRTHESEYDNVAAFTALLAASTLKPQAQPGPASLDSGPLTAKTGGALARVGRVAGAVVARAMSLEDASRYAYVTRRAKARVWRLLKRVAPTVARALAFLATVFKGRPALQYVTSACAWALAERRMPHSVAVAVPVHAYSVPFILSMMLVRLRMAVSDSYFYLLYI